MATLITSDSELRKYIPNIVATVKGENPLFDKLAPFLDTAEAWLCRYFVPAEMLDQVQALASTIVATEAYRLALPQLDVVLTPNGFATVGNQNLSPASKMRVDRLVGGLREQRDKAVNELLHILPSVEDWLTTAQAAWFAATLFPTLDVVAQSGETERLWDKYLELRSRIIDIEESLAEDFFSPELMTALRSENLRSDLTEKRSLVVRQIQAQVVGYLRGGSFNSRRLADIVNFIRQSENDFKEWHSSATAALFAPPVFRNDKKSSGYFF
jgi:hypothetical protein